MDELLKNSENTENDTYEFSFRKLFTPLTNKKAVIWIIVIGIIVYAGILFNGFVADDFPYIVNNPTLANFNIIDSFGKNLFNSGGYYKPLAALYIGFIYHFFGANPFIYHFSSLLLELGNTILLYFLLKKFTTNTIAFISSILFLVHPMNVESVAYIASSCNLYSVFFGLIALILSMNEHASLRKIFLIFSLILLSILAIESGVLFLILVVFIKFLYYKKQKYQFLIGAFCTLIMYLFLRFSTVGIQLNNYSFVPIHELSLTQRLINIPEIFYFYISTFIFPAKLALSQNWVVKTVDFTHFYSYLLADLIFLLGIFGIGYFVYKRKHHQLRSYVFFVLWFITGIGFLLQIYPLDATVAERWMYLPMVGLIGFMSIVFKNIHIRNTSLKNSVVSIFIVIIIIFSISTMIRNTNWYDDYTLNSHDITVVDDYSKEANLGEDLINNGEYSQALIHTQRSVDLNPFYGNISLVGSNYIYLGNTQKAEIYFSKLKNIPHDVYSSQIVYENLSWYLLTHNPKKAKDFILWSLHYYPKDSILWADLALEEYANHENKNALISIEKAKSIQSTPQISQLYLDILSNKSFEIPTNNSAQ